MPRPGAGREPRTSSTLRARGRSDGISSTRLRRKSAPFARDQRRRGRRPLLDSSIADDPVYAEHWAGKRRVEVTVEPDQIVIRRSD
jgi:hypothetical protein